jgi:ABC-type transport system involved in cytochrome bd biosynthesis fused ATPase/permease subunit
MGKAGFADRHSHGHALRRLEKRLAIARAAVFARLLLLDEPTNHLDVEASCGSRAAGREPEAFVAVSHDRTSWRRWPGVMG